MSASSSSCPSSAPSSPSSATASSSASSLAATALPQSGKALDLLQAPYRHMKAELKRRFLQQLGAAELHSLRYVAMLTAVMALLSAMLLTVLTS